MPDIIHVYNQSLTYDVRTRRYAQTINLKLPEYPFTLIGQRSHKSEKKIEPQGDNLKTVRLYLPSLNMHKKIDKVLAFILWNVEVFYYVITRRQVVLISAHSLKVLPVCAILALLKRSKLLYDTHEIETHTSPSSIFTNLLVLLEKFFMMFVDEIVVTSPGHENWYKEKYNKNVTLIRNCPSLEETKASVANERSLKTILNIPLNSILYVYVGLINLRRGCNTIIEAFKLADKSKHILFLGFGDVSEIVELSRHVSNIHYMEPVPALELVSYLQSADIGIHMMDSSCLNHKQALPNKPMQYMAAGLPVIVSDLPVMSKLIRDADSGWVLPEGDSNKLAKLVNSIKLEDIVVKKEQSKKWFLTNNWEIENTKLIELYQRHLAH